MGCKGKEKHPLAWLGNPKAISICKKIGVNGGKRPQTQFLEGTAFLSYLQHPGSLS